MATTTPGGPMRHDEAVVTVAGAPVRVYRAGSGPTLVLLHGGGLDETQLSWAPVWRALTAHARLVAPDLPGYGASPLGHTEPTLAGYRGWLLALLDTLGIQQAILAGLSLGGGIALRTALDAPARVAGLVGLAPCGVSPRPSGGTAGYFAGQLGGIGCRVLLLSGAHDRLVPPNDVRAATANVRHARFVLVTGAGHWLPRDAPEQVTDQLLGFLATAPAAPSAPARPDQ